MTADPRAARPFAPSDLTACDREPIHIPGAVQPHGMLLVVDPATMRVVAGAGDIEGRLAADWMDRPLAELVSQDVEALLAKTDVGPGGVLNAAQIQGPTETLDVSVHRSGATILVELEPAPAASPSAAAVLAWLDVTGGAFERATDLKALCERAAASFRDLTGYDRVMIYRFLDDDAGTVIAESRQPGLGSFLNHHFPASDIPKQARALYVRNRVRAIPDVAYTPAPLRPAGHAGIDLSDVALRSVSPVHVQYLRNMEIGASASVSIVKDGVLWGLVACHNSVPKLLPYDVRAACRALAGSLARQIRAKEEAELYRERLRLRGAEDAVLALIGSHDGALTELFDNVGAELRRMLAADGLAMVDGSSVRLTGRGPRQDDIVALADWVRRHAGQDPYASHELATVYPPAAAYQAVASGLLAVTLAAEEPLLLMWFRQERIEEVNWAGNPHKAVPHDPNAVLTPRASFEAWSETVRGAAAPWSLAEVEATTRLRRALYEARQSRRLRELNRELAATVADRESLLRQKDFLLKEVNHRVQNSLQLVSAFLGLQARAVDDVALAGHLAEAQRRLSAVSLVHRRLYRDDQVETVDLSRYIEELLAEMASSMGAEWGRQLSLELAPILISADRAVNVGLILTELVINANKYAYAGASGPISVRLEQQHRNRMRLIVADNGVGGHKPGGGFGTRMMNAMVERLAGTIDYGDNDPTGLRVIVAAPIQDR